MPARSNKEVDASERASDPLKNGAAARSYAGEPLGRSKKERSAKERRKRRERDRGGGAKGPLRRYTSLKRKRERPSRIRDARAKPAAGR